MDKFDFKAADDIKEFQKKRKEQIFSSFKKSDAETAEVLTKAEFEEKFNTEDFEVYSLKSVHKFREDIMKSEEIEDKDSAFKEATRGLKPFVIHGEGTQAVAFVRRKVKEDKE